MNSVRKKPAAPHITADSAVWQPSLICILECWEELEKACDLMEQHFADRIYLDQIYRYAGLGKSDLPGPGRIRTLFRHMEHSGEDSGSCQSKHLHLLSSAYHGCHICRLALLQIRRLSWESPWEKRCWRWLAQMLQTKAEMSISTSLNFPYRS